MDGQTNKVTNVPVFISSLFLLVIPTVFLHGVESVLSVDVIVVACCVKLLSFICMQRFYYTSRFA
jgi:hypothetical protein